MPYVDALAHRLLWMQLRWDDGDVRGANPREILPGHLFGELQRMGRQDCRHPDGTGTNNDYMFGGQWEFPLFDMGNTFSHAEMAYLMVPRPFMVERGMSDPVAQDFSVALEYAKVRRLYVLLGLADKTEMEIRNAGQHGFLCEGAFTFLHKHLNWPER